MSDSVCDFVSGTGWHIKSGTFVLFTDKAIRQSQEMISFNHYSEGGHVEHLNNTVFNMTTLTVVIEGNHFQNYFSQNMKSQLRVSLFCSTQ